MRRVLLPMLALVACAAPRRDWRRGELIVVGDPGRSGLGLDPEGFPHGRDADLLRAVADVRDRVLVWRQADGPRAVALLESGDADVGLPDQVASDGWEDLDRLPAPYERYEWAISPGVMELLLEALDELDRRGELEDIEERWSVATPSGAGPPRP